jgi:DNA adenine methylase
MNNQFKIKPFIKWAGGKTQLLPYIKNSLPKNIKNIDTYIEPFVGGGAVLFHILSTYPQIKNVVINDINPRLMNTYIVVRENPSELILKLAQLQKIYWQLIPNEQKQFYMEQRGQFNTKSLNRIDEASLFIFLNKTCFNGLYRENQKGDFNVSFGKHAKPLICDDKLILKISELLQNVDICHGDYANLVSHLKRQSFIYFDPPYRPLSCTSDFTSYSSDRFDDIQQKRLAAFCRFLSFNSNWMLSNSCTTDDNFFNEQYMGYTIRQVIARRSIGANANSRKTVRELLITNY